MHFFALGEPLMGGFSVPGVEKKESGANSYLRAAGESADKQMKLLKKSP